MVKSILPLSLDNVSVMKRGKTLIGPIDLKISSSGTTIILGPNGAGKTTLLRVMHGLERPFKGSVKWNISIQDARKKQAFVFQHPIMLRRSVFENITYPLDLQKIPSAEKNNIAYRELTRINLLEAKDMQAVFLSGGEKQKLALARALVLQPEILFLDEPTANLDGSSTREVETMIKEAVTSGIRVVMTTHDIGQGKRLADDVIFLYHGKIHEQGAAETFFSKPKTREAKAILSGEIVE